MRRILLAAALVTTLGTVGCGGPTSETSITTTSEGEAHRSEPGKSAARDNTALIRFFNADSQRPSLAVYSQNNAVFNDVAYKKITSYQEADRGVTQFALSADGKMEPTRRELFPGRHYTFIALPAKKGEGHLESLSDNLGRIEPGQARVRLINATTTVKDLDLYIQSTSTRVLRGSGSGDIVSFAEMYAADVEIRADNKPASGTLANLKVEPGKLYTFVAVNDGGNLDIVQIVDELESK
jgi:hypothetical protein